MIITLASSSISIMPPIKDKVLFGEKRLREITLKISDVASLISAE